MDLRLAAKNVPFQKIRKSGSTRFGKTFRPRSNHPVSKWTDLAGKNGLQRQNRKIPGTRNPKRSRTPPEPVRFAEASRQFLPRRPSRFAHWNLRQKASSAERNVSKKSLPRSGCPAKFSNREQWKKDSCRFSTDRRKRPRQPGRHAASPTRKFQAVFYFPNS